MSDLTRRRCSAHDWTIWLARARMDAVWAQTRLHRRRVDEAKRSLERFASGAPGYIGISWGKDSCAVLRLALELGVAWPLVHVRVEPVANPDCAATRDAWIAERPEIAARYYEIVVRCQTKPSTGRYDTNAAYEDGFRLARQRFGERRISGVRAEEAGVRSLTIRRNGLGDEDSISARPIGHWHSEDVFAWLRSSPLAPAYPCSLGGCYERGRVRVNNLWGLYGEGHGRAEWEGRYYESELRAIRAQHARDIAAPEEIEAHEPRLLTWRAAA